MFRNDFNNALTIPLGGPLKPVKMSGLSIGQIMISFEKKFKLEIHYNIFNSYAKCSICKTEVNYLNDSFDSM